MSNSTLKIFIRVVTRRINSGETLDEILESFTKLTDEEKEAIRNAINECDINGKTNSKWN